MDAGRVRRAGGGEPVKELPPQVQNQLAQFQQLQQQLQVLATQRLQLDAKLREVTTTLEELGKVAADTPVYRSTGALLLRVEDRAALTKELEDQKESIDLRAKTVKKQEEATLDKLNRLKSEIESAQKAPKNEAKGEAE